MFPTKYGSCLFSLIFSWFSLIFSLNESTSRFVLCSSSCRKGKISNRIVRRKPSVICYPTKVIPKHCIIPNFLFKIAIADFLFINWKRRLTFNALTSLSRRREARRMSSALIEESWSSSKMSSTIGVAISDQLCVWEGWEEEGRDWEREGEGGLWEANCCLKRGQTYMGQEKIILGCE